MNDPRLDVRDFRYFLAVGEELHFRRASERLRIAQPHLSQHIKQLEARLGVLLLDRTTRSVKLTHAGTEFLHRARYVISQINEAATVTRRLADGQEGHVAIAFSEPASLRMLPRILQEFRRLHPKVEISLSHGSTATQVLKLVEGGLHFGFLRLPIHTRRLRTLALFRESLVVAVPTSHALSHRTSLRLEELASDDFIQYSAVPGLDFQEIITSYCQRSGFSPHIVYEAADTQSLLTFVAAGFGIAIVPEYVRIMRDPRISFVSLPEIPPTVDLGLAWLPEDQAPVHRSFRDLVIQIMKEENYT